jgi:hypothetical protein
VHIYIYIYIYIKHKHTIKNMIKIRALNVGHMGQNG